MCFTDTRNDAHFTALGTYIITYDLKDIARLNECPVLCEYNAFGTPTIFIAYLYYISNLWYKFSILSIT